MAFKIGSTNYVGGTSPVFPLPTATARGSMMYNDGTSAYWAYPGDTTAVVGSGFELRTILTHGYMAGGYKGNNPWRSTNKTWHSTDVTVYCGEQLEYAVAYQEGYFSDYNGYVTGCQGDSYAGGQNQTVSKRTVSVNLANGQGRSRGQDVRDSYSVFGFGAGQNETGAAVSQGTGDAAVGNLGGWDGSSTRTFAAAATNQIGQVGYVSGGTLGASQTNTTDKMHFGTEIMYAGTASPANGASSGCSGETRAYWSFAGTRRYMAFSTDSTYSTWTTSTSADGWGKYLSTKKGFHYGSVGSSSIQANQIKFSDSSGADIGLSYAKVRSYSEENCQMGQEWGYVLGQHDGQQNNHSIKYIYATDVMYSMGSATRPKGHFGASSGVCWSAAASITNSFS